MWFIDPATLKEHGSARDQVRCAFAARQRMKMPAVYLVGRGDRRMASVDVTDARNFALDRHRREVHLVSASDSEVAVFTDGYRRTFETPRPVRILREFGMQADPR